MNWRKLRVGDCVWMNEATYSLKEKWPSAQYLDTGSITNNRVRGLKQLDLRKDKLPSRARRKARPGDIVYSTVRPNQRHFGILRNVPEGFLASTGFAVIRAREEVACTGFIYCFLTQDETVARLQTIAEHSTSAYPSIRPVDIKDLEINLPPLPEQRAIAHILGTLDDKIEVNRRTNETLEEMARTLFKSWFVDFDPVRAKMEGRDTGLSQDFADLVPDRMIASEMGEIPDGWGVGRLRDFIDVNPTRPLARGQLAPYLPMSGMPTRYHGPNVVDNIRPFGSGTRFCNGDTLIARITPCLENGKTAYVDFLAENEIGWGSTEYIVMRPQPPLPSHFAYCLARSAGFRRFAVQNMSGTSGRQRVPVSAVKRLSFAAPPPWLAEYFGDVAASLFDQAGRVQAESRTLAALRDTLLPKLLSGEIRVPDAERILERVS